MKVELPDEFIATVCQALHLMAQSTVGDTHQKARIALRAVSPAARRMEEQRVSLAEEDKQSNLDRNQIPLFADLGGSHV